MSEHNQKQIDATNQTSKQPETDQLPNNNHSPQPQQNNPKKFSQQQQQLPEISAEQLKLDQDLSDNELETAQQNNPELSTQHKNKGNELFKQGNHNDAILQYQQGLKYTTDKSARATLYSNMAICFMKEDEFGYARKYCKKVLREDQGHRKGRMNLARCYEHDNKIQEAYEEYKKVEQNLEGATAQDRKFVLDKIAYLKPKIDELNQSRKKQVIDGLKNIGNSVLGYFGMSLDNFKLQQGPGGGYNISFKQ